MVGQTLQEIIQQRNGGPFPEYSRPGLVVGGPSWMRTDRFDIAAKAANEAAPAEVMAMARQLLADRFRLRTHTEMRPVDVYVLTKARGDGRLGRGLQPSAVDCASVIAARRSGGGPTVVFAPPGGTRSPCASASGLSAEGVSRIAETWTINQLIRAFQVWMDRTVIDRTGLGDGYYEIDLSFDFATRNSPDPVNATAASIFTALREQLGLKLEARREPLEVLVIDGVERPTPD